MDSAVSTVQAAVSTAADLPRDGNESLLASSSKALDRDSNHASVGSQTPEEALQEVLGPLIDLLNKCRKGRYEPCNITTGDTLSLRSNFTSVLIEVPEALAYEGGQFPKLRETIVTLMYKGGSPFGCSLGGAEVDSYRTPLRFRLIKSHLFQHDGDAFYTETYLLVDVIDFDRAAAERQINLLVSYLRVRTNLLKLHEDNFEMF